jgi:excisionase family DNA binding protein
MPKTKLSQEIESRQKPVIRLLDIPDLPLTLTIAKAAEIAGVGYTYIRSLADSGKIKAIASGSKRVIPTWNFLVDMQLFPEALLEKIYIERLKNEQPR